MPRKRSRKTMRNKCDLLWGWCVREAAHDACALCNMSGVQAHHLIRRDAMWYRHFPENGIALCFTHHTGNNVDSAHGAPLGFIELLQRSRPKVYDWWEAHRHDLHIGEKGDYEDIYNDLKGWEAELKEGRYVERFIGARR